MSTELDLATADVLAENAALRAELLLAQADAAAARAANHIMYKALGQIDKHRVGACEYSFGDVECDACGDMRDIASAALKRVRQAGAP